MVSAPAGHEYLTQLKALLDRIPMTAVTRVIDRLAEAGEEGQRVFILGNGGSASTASHFACDLAKGTSDTVPNRFKVIALTDNIALMTAWANDSDYEWVFAEQLRNIAQPDDVVIAISASGRSPNVLRAAMVAKQIGADTVGLTGGDGGPLHQMVDFPINVPGGSTEQTEDAHLILEHLICTDLRRRYAHAATEEFVGELEQRRDKSSRLKKA